MVRAYRIVPVERYNRFVQDEQKTDISPSLKATVDAIKTQQSDSEYLARKQKFEDIEEPIPLDKKISQPVSVPKLPTNKMSKAIDKFFYTRIPPPPLRPIQPKIVKSKSKIVKKTVESKQAAPSNSIMTLMKSNLQPAPILTPRAYVL